ncbi:MAG: ribulose-phosphate 3-epimerase [Candidatus Melainabacteria bacterium]|nr:ribulose-phosphate 3-epimerase [Candidatus Melainabacteria bacterium]
MMLIAPSILSADFTRLGEEIAIAQKGGADWIHVDVMDGHFVPNLTIGAPVVKSIRKATTLPLDVHLMIEDPDKYLEDFAKAGADFITVHAEACTHLHRTLSYIKELGKKAGVALNPHTEPEVLKYVTDHVDLVLVMSVNPGFGGQKFIDSVIPKISQVKEIFEQSGKKDLYLSVDGGINFDTAPRVVRAGANVLVAGNTIYGSKSVSESISKLRQSAVAA